MTAPIMAIANPIVNVRLRPILKLRADSAVAPTAAPTVPMVFGNPERLADPVTCSAIRDETVTTPMYAVELSALPENRVPIRRERVCSEVSVGIERKSREPQRSSHLQGGHETSVSEDRGGTVSLRTRYGTILCFSIRTSITA
jgi:hypothetical protein